MGETTHPVAGRSEAGVVGTSTARLLSILLQSRLAWGLVLVLSCPFWPLNVCNFPSSGLPTQHLTALLLSLNL